MNWMQWRRPIQIACILVLTVASAYAIFFHKPIHESIKLGLDLRSGTHILLELKPKKGEQATTADVDQVKKVLEERINQLGTTEPIIQRQGLDRIIVDLPAITDPEKALEIVTRTAFLEFKELKGKDPKTGEEKWETVLTGEFLKDAYDTADPNSGKPMVLFELKKPEGAKRFARITERLINKPLGIFLDDVKIDAPIVQGIIDRGSGQISGGTMDQDAAHRLAILLRAGALRMPVKPIEVVTVGPTLGQEALVKSLWAGAVGVLFVALFMIWCYRLPGVVADVALVVYALVLMAVMVVFKFTLTLPGIAGFVLSIGMAVDANVLIFERLKEELKGEKTLRGAIEAGFQRAFSSILDSHVTTIIGAGALYYLGSSSVKGFGLTLALGTLLSLFTAVFVTRVFMEFIVEQNVSTNRALYGQ
ncbi:MAG: protein translocase subunit SecD [Armatimonadetes bacterium]|nr:protein translocase subunit SecD [Armatimonadota bacterium]